MTERPNPDPEEIVVKVDVVFNLTFERDPERGGYWARCAELPEVAAFGKTLKRVRADAAAEIRLALQDRTEDDAIIPPLRYVPPWRRRQRPYSAMKGAYLLRKAAQAKRSDQK